MQYFRLICGVTALLLAGCATLPYDYSAYREAHPKSILILTPINQTHDVKATLSFYATTSRPLAESGYYVFPVGVVYEIFQRNGLSIADEMHQVSREKLRAIFGADAALYITITDYGTQYFLISSASVVRATAVLIDLQSGKTLWEGAARASSEETHFHGQQNDLGTLLVQTLIQQIVGTVLDESYQVSQVVSARLLSAKTPNGVLYGPYKQKNSHAAF